MVKFRTYTRAFGIDETACIKSCKGVPGCHEGCRALADTVPEASSFEPFSLRKYASEVSIEELAKIINQRRAKSESDNRVTRSSLSVNDPDYLPITFLDRARRCADAVCLLKRNYRFKDLESAIGHLQPGQVPVICDCITQRCQSLDASFPADIWTMCAKISDVLETQRFQDFIQANSEDIVALPYGTGVLVAPNYLLTNNHVLTKATADEFIAEFRYEIAFLDQEKPTVSYLLDKDFLFSNPVLDYALIKVKNFGFPEDKQKRREKKRELGITFEQAGANFGWLPMQDNASLISPPLRRAKAKQIKELVSTKLLPENLINSVLLDRAIQREISGEPVHIIQHPQGRPKEIVLFNNRVQKIYENFLQYETDADFGSSGSPLLNSQLQLIGIHHAALFEINRAEAAQTSEAEALQMIGNLGIRVHQIVKDLRENYADEEEVQILLKRYVVDPDNPPQKGRFFIVAGRDRTSVLGAERAKKEQILIQGIVDQIKQRTKQIGTQHFLIDSKGNSTGFEIIFVLDQPDEQATTDPIGYINRLGSDKENDPGTAFYKPGDVALEILLDSYDEPADQTQEKANLEKPVPRGATVFYFPDLDGKRKINAQAILQNVMLETNRNQACEQRLPDRSVQPDSATVMGRLAFCRDILMPSLVLYLGFVSNLQDVAIIENRSAAIASGICNGMLACGETLSPIGFL